MSIKNFNKFFESKIQNISSRYIDYYYLDDDIDLTKIRNIYEIVNDNFYRGIATFVDQIENFKDFDNVKIALINYPPERHTKRNLKRKLEDVIEIKDFVDEVEFPWDEKYLKWDKDYWRNLVLKSIKNGLKLRPMLEIGVMKKEDIKNTLDFLKEIGIRSFVTSTGLIQEITTLEKWEKIKDIVPRVFETKVVGIVTLKQINNFIKSDIDLAATTISITNNYNLSDDDKDYFGDDEQWSLPTNF